jgi:hypothetical protein
MRVRHGRQSTALSHSPLPLLRSSLALAANPNAIAIICRASNASSLAMSHAGVVCHRATMPKAVGMRGQATMGHRRLSYAPLCMHAGLGVLKHHFTAAEAPPVPHSAKAITGEPPACMA